MTLSSAQEQRLSLIIFSPMPPQRNGIADYTAGLLPGLQAAYDCTVVVEDGHWDAHVPTGTNLIQMSEYKRGESRFDEALHLYHVGNSRDHIYMLEPLANVPGLVVLHDAGLHHLLDSATLERGDGPAYVAALTAEYGWAGHVLANQFSRWGLRGARMHAELPMIRGIVGPARGVIVHSATTAAYVRLYAPETEIRIINHYVLPALPNHGAAAQAIRDRFGVVEGQLLIVSLGFVTRAKQIDLVLRAIASVKRDLPIFCYLIAGEASPGELDVARLAAELGLSDRVILTGYLLAEDVDAVLAAADVVVNLRHPTLGETSGTLMRALAHGVCTIVTDAGAFRDIPQDVSLRLPWDNSLLERLAALLVRLARDPALRRQVGDAGARWTREACSLAGAVQAYCTEIKAAATRKPIAWTAAPDAWRIQPRIAASRVDPTGVLWRDAGLGVLPEGRCRVMAVFADPADDEILAEWLGREPDLIVRPRDWMKNWTKMAKREKRTIDLAIIRISAKCFSPNLLSWLSQLNTLMSFGAMLILDVDGGAIRMSVLLREEEGRSALQTAGFEVEATASAPTPSLVMVEPFAYYGRAWRAVKISEFVTALPSLPSAVT